MENCSLDTTRMGRNNTEKRPLLLVGEGLHILNPAVHAAIDQRNSTGLAGYARQQVEAGAGALAVNLGPGKTMQSHLAWVIDTLRSETDVPLFVSAGALEEEELLKKHTSIIINAVTADPLTLARSMQVAKRCGTGLVVLLVKPGSVSSDVNSRVNLGFQVLETAQAHNFPLEQLYLDPVLGCRPDPSAVHVSRGFPDISTTLESIALLHELNRSVRTIIGLGNCSVGLSQEKRSSLHRRILPLLAHEGLDAAIINCLDRQLVEVATGLTHLHGQHTSEDLASAA